MAEGPNKRKRRTRVVEVSCLGGTERLEVCALATSEIEDVVQQARETGWYGNVDLIDMVLDSGVVGGLAPQSRLAREVFPRGSAAREIWILTLREFRAMVAKLNAVSGIDVALPRVRRYRFADLATPGLLAWIRKDADLVDVEGYLEDSLDHCVQAAKIDGRLLEGAELRSFVIDHLDVVVPQMLLYAQGFDRNALRRFPLRLVEGPALRVWVADTLANTLDWAQYRNLLFAYNRAIDELLFHSRALGGVPTPRAETHIDTGAPGFLDLVAPVTHLPLHVCEAAMKEAGGLSRTPQSRGYRRRLRSLYEKVLREHASRVLTIPEGDREAEIEFVARLVNQFAREVNNEPDLVEKLCHVFPEAFFMDIRDQLYKTGKRVLEQADATPTDATVLVEGRSDAVLFQKALDLTEDQSQMIIRIEGCEGKADVARRFRLYGSHTGFGAVVAVVDADAEKEYEEMQRLARQLRYAQAFKFESGTVEDRLPSHLHVQALKDCYGIDDLPPEKLKDEGAPIAERLSRFVWLEAQATFDKVQHAKHLAALLERAEDIPRSLSVPVQTAVALAKDLAAATRSTRPNIAVRHQTSQEVVRRLRSMQREWSSGR